MIRRPPRSTLFSLHDALPIFDDDASKPRARIAATPPRQNMPPLFRLLTNGGVKDRKSTRLNSSHTVISYAVFCLKKKNTNILLFDDIVQPKHHDETTIEERY